MNVAYLGIPGSYTYMAAKRLFSSDADFTGSLSINDVFAKVIHDKCQVGVVPIENSTTGSIFETYDCLTGNNLNITGEVYLSFHHQLAWNAGTKISDLKICYSHPQAIAQCRNFIIKMPKINIVNVSDTATAAKLVSKSKTGTTAAITSKLSARLYGLKIGAENIEDNKKNFTRFSIVSKKKNSTGTKLSLLIKLKHVSGSLYRALEPIALLKYNLTKIESRPILGSIWEYLFILDLEIDSNTQNLKNLLADLKKITYQAKVLGIYNKGIIYDT